MTTRHVRISLKGCLTYDSQHPVEIWPSRFQFPGFWDRFELGKASGHEECHQLPVYGEVDLCGDEEMEVL